MKGHLTGRFPVQLIKEPSQSGLIPRLSYSPNQPESPVDRCADQREACLFFKVKSAVTHGGWGIMKSTRVAGGSVLPQRSSAVNEKLDASLLIAHHSADYSRKHYDQLIKQGQF